MCTHYARATNEPQQELKQICKNLKCTKTCCKIYKDCIRTPTVPQQDPFNFRFLQSVAIPIICTPTWYFISGEPYQFYKWTAFYQQTDQADSVSLLLVSVFSHSLPFLFELWPIPVLVTLSDEWQTAVDYSQLSGDTMKLLFIFFLCFYVILSFDIFVCQQYPANKRQWVNLITWTSINNCSCIHEKFE